MKRFNIWFWNLSIIKISLIVSILFFVFGFLATKSHLLEVIFNSLEPLGLILAVTLYLKESPQRRKKQKYEALLTIDTAAGIKSSKARLVALEDLVDLGVKLEEIDLSNSNLIEIEINGAEMNKSNFRNSTLKNSTLNLCKFQKCDFSNSNGSGTESMNSNFSFSNFKDSNFNNSNFKDSNFMFCSFNEASFIGADFTGANLKGVKFENAILNGAIFKNANVDIEELLKAEIKKAILPDGNIYNN
ncbi:pentapeptide repeat-containing protein [Flavobacteriaceae bacterium]|nr:pentapeptide repeat-containing protein [Flavobacteriaceae bacterium]MDB4267157.1 pentapeptide repeat-containing protein [Flavobacteriaceae bacterium]MDB4612449.1 pentapeptide repeat-containing protein [Flavobacteriaceae bacterium]